ncbi:MAG: aquaporin family protein [Saprospiraceae bacterium]|nr:aquaporin family protein [Saprospiraceae bacterium]
MTPFWSEFIGTMLLILLGDGVVAGILLKSSKAENGGWIVITLAWGLAVTMAIYAVGQISGAHLNPAVTLGLAAEGSFPWEKVPGYLLAQVLGAIVGAMLVWLHYLPHWSKTEDPATKLGVFCTAPAIRSTWSNLISETIGTFVLVAGVLFIGANKFTEGLNPIVVGALVVSIGMSLGGTTGYAINPARDLGPRIAHALLPIAGKGGSDWGYAWVPVVGPIIGGLLGAAFYCAAFKADCQPWAWAVFLVFIAMAWWAYFKEKKA